MESIFIKPNNEVIEVNDKDIYDFCKKECENFANKSLENIIYFSECKKQYTYFNIYYDFVIHELKYIHKGYLLDKTKTISDISDKYYGMSEIDSIDYNEIIQYPKTNLEFLRANDINLDITGSYFNDYGFMDHNSIMLTVKYMCLHSTLAHAIMSQIVIEDYDICMDYQASKYKQYSDYLVERLGFIKIGSYSDVQEIIYNPCFCSRKQKEIIYFLKDYGCYEIEHINNENEDKKFVLKFRSNYENRRI